MLIKLQGLGLAGVRVKLVRPVVSWAEGDAVVGDVVEETGLLRRNGKEFCESAAMQTLH